MLWIRHGRYYKLKHIQTQNSYQVFHIKLQKDIPILYHEKDLRIFFFWLRTSNLVSTQETQFN